MVKNYDYARHNEEYLELTKDGRQPGRVTMTLSANPQVILANPDNNPDGITFEEYMGDFDVMIDVEARFQEYTANQYFCDRIMGFDNIDGLSFWLDSQNTIEHCHFGGKIAHHGVNVPSTVKYINDENKYKFTDRPFPSIEDGPFGRSFEFYTYCLDLQKKGFAWKGKPIKNVIYAGAGGTDGPITVACDLMGATEICIALYEEEDFALDFLGYITDATICRIKEARKKVGQPEKTPGLYFADDCICLLSADDYIRFMLPLHKRIFSELTTGEGPYGIHLCGDVTRHLLTIRDELNVTFFDTGYPIKHGKLMQDFGPDIGVSGGVHAALLLNGSEDAVRNETRRILEEVKPHTRKFIMKEANAVCTRTPTENILAMYETVKKYGWYDN